MEIKFLRNTAAAAVMSLAALLAPAAVSANGLGANWTTTLYDAGAGIMTFESDPLSIYDLSNFEVELSTTDIFTGGGSVVGTLFEFVIPNFIDTLPRKDIVVTMTGQNAGAGLFERAGVLSIVGADSDSGSSLPTFGSLVSSNGGPVGGNFIITEAWEMFPNPDFEIVEIFVPVAFELASIQIDTASVPIPGAAWMFGSALAGLVLVRRRQNA